MLGERGSGKRPITKYSEKRYPSPKSRKNNREALSIEQGDPHAEALRGKSELQRNSFDRGLERRLFIARNNFRLNACLSTILLLAQIFPLLLPWYADSNFDSTWNGEGEPDPSEKLDILIYKKKSRSYLIVSLFSVFINNRWMPIRQFIDSECPFVMKSGFECLKMSSFQYAAAGVRA